MTDLFWCRTRRTRDFGSINHQVEQFAHRGGLLGQNGIDDLDGVTGLTWGTQTLSSFLSIFLPPSHSRTSSLVVVPHSKKRLSPSNLILGSKGVANDLIFRTSISLSFSALVLMVGCDCGSGFTGGVDAGWRDGGSRSGDFGRVLITSL